MPALTPDAIHTLTETLADLTDYLRENPTPAEALALVEPLLDEHSGLPVQFADTLRALARVVLENPDTPRTAQGDLLITELRTAARDLADKHVLHYVLDDLRDLYGSSPTSEQECSSCR